MDKGFDNTIFIAAPGRDGELTCQVLSEAGMSCKSVRSIAEFLVHATDGAGVALFAEEMLDQKSVSEVVEFLSRQPPWSDLPIIIVEGHEDVRRKLKAFADLRNVSVLTRPMTLDGLVTSVSAALRARNRQYEVRDLLQEKEENAKRKDEFLAMLAHELRNPLAPVRTSLQVIKMHNLENNEIQKAVTVGERSIQHLSHLIDDLLDVSRITHGKVEMNSEPVDMAEVIRLVGDSVRGRADEKGVRFSVEIEGTHLMVVGDRTRLEQAIINMLDNAIKFTPPNGIVTVWVGFEPGQIIIRIKDTGVGIAAEDLPHVFDLFVQSDRSLDRTPGGLGVGLTIVKGIIEQHAGTVRLSSDGVGKGTVAEILLPRTGNVVPFLDSPLSPSPFEGRLRVLVVDDNRDGADSLATFLTLTGCDARTAYDGKEALTLFQTFKPDAVLLDIGLPGMNGYEVAKHIRQHPEGQNVTIVAVTGYGRDDDRKSGQQAGFNHHLVKPIDLDTVGEILSASSRQPIFS
jgi:two-component system, sensor histidine kinase